MPSTPSPSPSKQTGSSGFAVALPVAVWLAMLAWWTIPPYLGQIQDREAGPFSWDWRLQRPPAQICDVRYFDMSQAGAPIERWELLGFETRKDMPPGHARVRESSLPQATRSVCARLRKAGNPTPEVEAFVRCDADGRFEIREDRDRNVCAPEPKNRGVPHQ